MPENSNSFAFLAGFLVALILAFVAIGFLVFSSSPANIERQKVNLGNGSESQVKQAPLANRLSADETNAKVRSLEKPRSRNRIEVATDRPEEYPETFQKRLAKFHAYLKSNPKPDGPMDLFALDDDEKNRIWWEIAAVARRGGAVAYRYTLTTEAALKIGEKYEVSVLHVFKFFRESATAEWRSEFPPDSSALDGDVTDLPGVEEITDEDKDTDTNTDK